MPKAFQNLYVLPPHYPKPVNKMMQRCQTCMAVGKCPECGGRGSIPTPLHNKLRLPCEACDGSGKCPECNGHGKVRAKARDGNVSDILQSQYEASTQRERDEERRLQALKSMGVDPAAPRWEPLRQEFGIWASKDGRLLAKPRRWLTEDSSLYDILLEDQERGDAMLDYLTALEKRVREG